MEASNPAWRSFLVICDAVTADDFEMTVEEFAPFYAAFRRLLAIGAPFDPAFVDHVEGLNRQAMGTDDDGDHDDADEGLDPADEAVEAGTPAQDWIIDNETRARRFEGAKREEV